MRDPRTLFRSAMPRLVAPLVSLILALVASGCEGGGATSLSVHIVDGSGGNPVDRISDGRAELTVVQLGTPAPPDAIASGRIRDGRLCASSTSSAELCPAIDLQITSYALPTTIDVQIVDNTGGAPLVGTTVPFAPIGFLDVRVVVGTPETCVPLSSPHLPVPLVRPAITLVPANVLVFGGLRDGATPRSDVHVLSPVTLTALDTPDLLSTLDTPVGEASSAILVSELSTYVLVVSSRGGMRYDAAPSVTGPRDAPLALHVGASERSSVLALGDVGAIVVGGSGTGAYSFVAPDGRTVDSHTPFDAVPRERPALAQLGDGVLVAGGSADPAAPLFEWIPAAPTLRESGRVRFGDGLPAREGAILAVGPTGDAVLAFGRDPASGALLSDVVVVSGCPTRCTATVTAITPTPRAFPVAVPRPARSSAFPELRRDPSTLVVGGEVDDGAGGTTPTALMTSIRWASGMPVFEDAPAGLSTPRADHTAIELGSGITLVAGGRSATRTLDDLELCF